MTPRRESCRGANQVRDGNGDRRLARDWDWLVRLNFVRAYVVTFKTASVTILLFFPTLLCSPRRRYTTCKPHKLCLNAFILFSDWPRWASLLGPRYFSCYSIRTLPLFPGLSYFLLSCGFHCTDGRFKLAQSSNTFSEKFLVGMYICPCRSIDTLLFSLCIGSNAIDRVAPEHTPSSDPLEIGTRPS